MAIFAIMEKNHVNNELRPGESCVGLNIVTPSESFKDRYVVRPHVILNAA